MTEGPERRSLRVNAWSERSRRVRAGAFAAVALALVVAGCAEKTAAPVTRPASGARLTPEDQLRRDLQAIFTDSNVDHAFWSVSVQSLKHGGSLYSLNASRMQVPASNQKLITSAVAAERLGWDYRYSTKIYTTGPLSEGGDLDGDLIIVSNGDPTINPRHPDRWGAFDAWARQLYAKGIRRVGGNLIGDDNAFAEPGYGFGWAWDDLVTGYGAAVGALQYNENEIELMILPGEAAGNRAIISLSPPGGGVLLDHGVTTAAAGQPSRINVARIPGAAILRVSGQVAIDSPPVTEHAAVPNPTHFYLNALRATLERHRIFVGGSSLDVDDQRVKPDYSRATLVLEDQSPTLDAVIDVVQKWSSNVYSETLLRSLAPGGAEATAEAGLAVVNETLTKWGVKPELYVARDGSGLSRNDYIAPDALIALLTHVWGDDRLREKFQATLALSATNGLLAERMKDTPAAGRVWAKTGSMSNVRSLSGYVMTLDSEPLVFSIIVNGYHVPSSRIEAAMDEALVRLVKFPRELHEE
ncbi:MAG: D-alanyl-D-alanine carboxypeptidase/D-alanyl-D-alanine-endopeptidase [Cyanobacteria bacterium]|nr:D-alanyl-D-alanine carboxypeptidase/D-alanyl-D-alanine-endopeptidase [Cyanobacteriota bacterium]